MFFKGIAIFFIIHINIEYELRKRKRATQFTFGLPSKLFYSACGFFKSPWLLSPRPLFSWRGTRGGSILPYQKARSREERTS